MSDAFIEDLKIMHKKAYLHHYHKNTYIPHPKQRKPCYKCNVNERLPKKTFCNDCYRLVSVKKEPVRHSKPMKRDTGLDIPPLLIINRDKQPKKKQPKPPKPPIIKRDKSSKQSKDMIKYNIISQIHEEAELVIEIV